MKTLRVRAFSEATSREAFVEAFCEAAQYLRSDPFRVGLLPKEADALFLTLPLPVPRDFWLVERGGVVVGRIGASVSSSEPKRGTVGFFEVVTEDAEAAALLLATAETWLKSQGVETAYGPTHFNTWFPYRFRVGGTNDTNFSWEPVNPPEYPQAFLRAGFVKDMSYHSELLDDLAGMHAKFEGPYRKTLEDGYTYRPIDTGAGLDAEIPILYRLSVIGFKNNHLFDPISEPMFRMLYVAQARKRQPLGCFFVSHAEQGVVGFHVGFVDEANQFVAKSMAVLPEHQSRGLSLGLFRQSFEAALERGYDKVVTAFIQAGNRTEAPARRTSIIWQHEYALFRKTIA